MPSAAKGTGRINWLVSIDPATRTLILNGVRDLQLPLRFMTWTVMGLSPTANFS